VSAAELRQLGCKAKLLGEVGFTAAELIKGGFHPREVEAVQTSADGVTSVSALRAKGYSAAELRMIGFQVAEMRSGGYTCRQVREGGFTQEELLEGGFRQRSVDATDGRPVSTLRVEGRYYAKDLAAIGFTTQEMFEGGYSTKELTEIGVGVAELKAAGASAGALREAGVAGRDLKAAGYTLRQLREGGFAWKELVIFLRSTHAELVEAGFAGLDPKDMIFKQYRPE
jgi:intracellular multiplication protein IcmE